MEAQPATTYEVWQRDVRTGEVKRRMHETGYSNPRVPTLMARDYNALAAQHVKETKGSPAPAELVYEYFVVEATTTFKEVEQ